MFFCFFVSRLLRLLSPQTLMYLFKFWERHEGELLGEGRGKGVEQGII